MRLNKVLMILLLLGLTSAAWAQVTIKIDTINVNKGNEITLPVKLDNLLDEKIMSCYLELEYDADVVTLSDVSVAGTIIDGWGIATRTDTLGLIKVALYGTDFLDTTGTVLNLDITASGEYGASSPIHFRKAYFNANNEADPTPITNDGLIIIKLKPVNVTITTNIGNNSFVFVDGAKHSAPFKATWDHGQSHQIGVDTLQNLNENTRYRFSSWSDGGAQVHQIAPTSDVTITAELTTQHQVQVISAYGAPTGAGWYTEGAEATIQVEELIPQVSGKRYAFEKWQGSGENFYSGTNNPATFTVNGPATEKAVWKTQFELQVATLPEGVTEISGAGWYDRNTEASTGEAPASVGEGTAAKDFHNWLVDGEKVIGNPISIKMDTSHIAIAAYEKNVNVTIGTDLSAAAVVIVDGDTLTSPAKRSWISGSEHTISVPELQNDSAERRFQFTGWTDDENRERTITVSSDTNFIAQYEKQFKLSIETRPENVADLTEVRWETANSEVEIGPAPDSLSLNDVPIKFYYWLVDNTTFYEHSVSITLDTAKVVTAYYLKNFYIIGKVGIGEIPAPNVMVYLTNGKTDTSQTNDQGEFIFDDLVAGDYMLTAEAEGMTFSALPKLVKIDGANIKDIQISATDIQAPYVEVLFPNGGEELEAESSTSIIWAAEDNVKIDSVVVFLSTDNGGTWEIIAKVAGDQTSLKWDIPAIDTENCLIRVEATDCCGNSNADESNHTFTITDEVGVDNEVSRQEFSFQLYQNYPNPFNPTTEIVYELPKESHVTLKIFNLNGQEVVTLTNSQKPAGIHRVSWQAENMPSGIYFCRIQSDTQVAIRRMVLAK